MKAAPGIEPGRMMKLAGRLSNPDFQRELESLLSLNDAVGS
jgi:hypothetical protein